MPAVQPQAVLACKSPATGWAWWHRLPPTSAAAGAYRLWTGRPAVSSQDEYGLLCWSCQHGAHAVRTVPSGQHGTALLSRAHVLGVIRSAYECTLTLWC